MTSRPLRRAVVALGSNIEPERWVPWAIARLQARFRDVLVSTAYRAAAVGPPGQPPFVNAVVVLATDLPLPALRAALRHLEALAGRTRSEDRFAPRTLDLDVIALSGPRGDEHLDHAETDVAHVVVPWADVEPDRRLRDGGRTLAERAAPLRDRLSAFTPS
ncbi:MAG: 2-amino-4-hydroxy-6-hydroxymethyldihydropteridine diphosphokinase [Planctomycetes bacterium]|nr:2-amino-4-hydroxy-6-hydroxymethyldihydropteridine diphosphokinase [Planctomycetota bacterium]MCB9824328.1 2-amino-4-hydroxy-6-hydroxymethyldihydropteridine diphosphokinase [Planctomycetota bacterium]MCB9900325.1 2-amino-4-hydroxy-6-hydroxymethyldihydropteridine diphosphokinase [Planctomycetota bacterium]